MARVKNTSNFFIALSLTNLLLIGEWFMLVLSPKQAYFSRSLGLMALLAYYVFFAVLIALIFLMLYMADSTTTKNLRKSLYLVLLSLLFIPLNEMRVISGFSQHYPFFSYTYFLGNWGVVGNRVAFFLFVFFLLWAYFRYSELIIIYFRNFCLFLSMAVFVTLGRSSWEAISDNWKATHSIHPSHSGTSQSQSTRVVWLIYDEMDEYYSTKGRPASILMPSLESFKKQSFVATQAMPPGRNTVTSLPSYIVGDVVTDWSITGRSDIQLKTCRSGAAASWVKIPNIFQKTTEMGLKSALIGWHHPYCRILGESLDYCYSLPALTEPFRAELLPNIFSILNRRIRVKPDWVRIHSRQYREISERADDPILDPRFQFITIHWPIPHTPSVLLPSKRDFFYPEDQYIEDYFNNLILVDQSLDNIQRRMKASKIWDNTHLIVTSDHWWRYLDEKSLKWEKEKVLHHNIPFILKLAGQSEGFVYDKPLNTTLMHDLTIELLKEKLKKPTEVARWLDARKDTWKSVPFDTHHLDNPLWTCAKN